MGETRKRASARAAEKWFDKYLVGSGIDIGCGDDPVTKDCRQWDMPDGDAQYLAGVEDSSFDWVYSSHCLEHVVDPTIALGHWWRVLKPGGYLIVMVPDEDLYEQGHWPPIFNPDHKSTWTIRKRDSWSPVSHNLLDELEALPGSQVQSVKLHATGYDYTIQGEYKVALHLPSMKLGELIQAQRALTPAMLQAYPAPLKHLGFFAIDQTTEPMSAEVSLEGIAKKGN